MYFLKVKFLLHWNKTLSNLTIVTYDFGNHVVKLRCVEIFDFDASKYFPKIPQNIHGYCWSAWSRLVNKSVKLHHFIASTWMSYLKEKQYWLIPIQWNFTMCFGVTNCKKIYLKLYLINRPLCLCSAPSSTTSSPTLMSPVSQKKS